MNFNVVNALIYMLADNQYLFQLFGIITACTCQLSDSKGIIPILSTLVVEKANPTFMIKI